MNKLSNDVSSKKNLIDSYISLLKTMKEKLNNLQKQIKKFAENNQIIINNLKEAFIEIKKEIDNNLLILNNFDDYNTEFNADVKEKILKSLKKQYDILNIRVVAIYDNDNITEIKELINELNYKLDSLFDYEFEPPNINSFMDSNLILDISNKFYGISNSYNNDINREISKIDKTFQKCSICNNNEAKFLDKICGTYICENCYNNNKPSCHEVEIIDSIDIAKLLNKGLFLESARDIIIYTLLMINLLLNYENMEIIDDKDKSSKKYIKREIKYPNIEDNKDFNSYLKFLKEMNTKINEFNNTPLNINEFSISWMNIDLIGIIKNIIKDDKINLYKDTLEVIENNFFSDDDFFSDE